MWQTWLAIGIVALAAALVGRRLWRALRGARQAGCCCPPGVSPPPEGFECDIPADEQPLGCRGCPLSGPGRPEEP